MKTGTAKRAYNTAFKKNSAGGEDPYRFRRSPKGILSCRECGAVYFHVRWSLEVNEAIRARVAAGDLKQTYCPACLKIRDGYTQGIVEISGIESHDKSEILRLLRNEETRAREKNPLERIVAIVTGTAGMTVKTTTEKLAQRLGGCLKKARGGKLVYRWSHRNKFARIYVGLHA